MVYGSIASAILYGILYVFLWRFVLRGFFHLRQDDWILLAVMVGLVSLVIWIQIAHDIVFGEDDDNP